MNRRLLLKLLAATALSACNTRKNAAKDLRVVVVGAGIIGASIAYHLAKAGATVTVIDKQGPATHASRGTFAWINATWAKQPRSYHGLAQDSVAGWKSLQQEMDLPIRWNGSLEWFGTEARQEKLAEQIAEQFEWGEDARMVPLVELADMEPNVQFGDTKTVALSGNDGAVDPVAATHALLAAAKKLGATVQFPCELIEITKTAGQVSGVETSTGSINADKVVLATGAEADAGERFAGSAVPQRSTPGVIAISTPLPPLLSRILVAPGIHMHQRQDGRMVLGEQDGAPPNEAHGLRLAERPYDFPAREFAEQHFGRMMLIAERFLPAIAGAELDDAYIGWRPLPLDGHPVLGASGAQSDVYLAIMHSGVTLAPVVGQLAALELAEGTIVERLDEFRPDRNFELIKRY